MTTRTMARKQARYPQIWGTDAMQNISWKPMSTDLGGAKAIVFKSLLKLKQLSSSRTQQEEDFYRILIFSISQMASSLNFNSAIY